MAFGGARGPTPRCHRLRQGAKPSGQPPEYRPGCGARSRTVLECMGVANASGVIPRDRVQVDPSSASTSVGSSTRRSSLSRRR